MVQPAWQSDETPSSKASSSNTSSSEIGQGDGRSAAMKTIGKGLTFFLVLIVLALATQAAGFISLYFLDDHTEAFRLINQYSPDNIDQMPAQAHSWYELMVWIYPVAKLAGFIAGSLVVVTLILANLLSMVAGARGIRAFISAFFWSLILMVLVSPWQEILKGTLFQGALYTLHDLTAWITRVIPANGPRPSVMTQIHFFTRFLGLPAITLIVLVLAQARFLQGKREFR